MKYFEFLFSQFLFPDRLTVLKIFIFVESVSYFYGVFEPTKTDAQQIFSPQFPGVISLNSKVGKYKYLGSSLEIQYVTGWMPYYQLQAGLR